MRISRSLLVLCALSTVVACGPRRTYETYRIPPRIDLSAHEVIGVIEFDAPDADRLSGLVTQRFTDLARRDQGMVRMLDVGTRQHLLETMGRSDWDLETPAAVGRRLGVQTLVVGELTVSDVRPDLKLGAALRSGTLTAQVDASLTVKLIEATTGASLWSNSASATKTVGHVSVVRGGNVSFDAEDPEQAYGPLIDFLVGEVTRDFQASWGRRVVN